MSCQKDDDKLSVVIEDDDQTETTSDPVYTEYFNQSISEAMESNKDNHEVSGDEKWEEEGAITIQLNETSITTTEGSVEINGTTATITKAGIYIIQGTLSDGQIMVNTEDEETVKIVLNNVSVTNTSNAPFGVMSAEKVVVFLPENTQNTFSDATTYVYEGDEDEPNATFFSKADLSIYGTGNITVNANYNDGISSKDGLIISSGNFTINSVDDGIRGKDYLIIKGGTFNVQSDGDAFKSDNDDDEDRGYILIENGTFNVATTAGDGFSAETDLLIADGAFDLVTGGGSDSFDEEVSSKALKAGINNVIEGGTFTINSADDALHCDGNLVIGGGTFSIASGDDGIHADEELTINGGEITITESYEGLESNVLTINDGTIHLVSSDDGINGAGGNDGSGIRPGQGNSSSSSKSSLYIQGGYIVVEASGDGVDVNGSIEMTAGILLVNGPAQGANGPLDYDNSFKISGGLLIAAGTSNMAQAPSSTSTQNSILLYLDSQSANTLFVVQNSEGEALVTYSPSVRYESIVYSSSKLVKSSSYKVYIGGSATGSETDGLYEDATYNSGTLVSSFTLSSTITQIN
ncbi:carbohydrate-binding domain-containing protein [Reichenbachiella sp. MALMAid0571]|uniref:carbohydrate-binding domain-containing protein n=1 Tax=Reichenbachiella sp. MALMAid0571 TaxID=3143939 RepID=UPI0032DEBE5A